MLYMNYFIGKSKHILKKVCSIRVLILLRVSLQINVYIISNKAAPLIVASLLLTRLKKKNNNLCDLAMKGALNSLLCPLDPGCCQSQKCPRVNDGPEGLARIPADTPSSTCGDRQTRGWSGGAFPCGRGWRHSPSLQDRQG